MSVDSQQHAELRDRGQITLPAAVREALGATTGDQIVFNVLDTGAVVITAGQVVPKSQAWFWTPEWQEGELEATAQVTSGREGLIFKDAGEMFDHLNRLAP